MKKLSLLLFIFTSILFAGDSSEVSILLYFLIATIFLTLAYWIFMLKRKVQNIIEQYKEKEQLLFRQNRLVAMGEMMGNIAHQWKQPLNNIALLILNIENAHKKNQLSSEYLNNKVYAIEDTIEYMSQTIEDFSDFLSPNKEKHNFYINDSIEKAIELTSPSLIQNNIDIIFLDDDEYKLFGRKSELIQVIMILINNARDALIKDSNNNHKEIIINLSQKEHYIILTIKDNGLGIPTELINKIFTPYFTTNTNEKGRGLGLYMAKTIIESSSGTIDVKNDNGALFQIIFLSSEPL